MSLAALAVLLPLLQTVVPQSGTPARERAAPVRGTVQLRSFFSPALGARKRYLVYLPPSYSRARARRYPVAYLLHGRTGNEADWISRGDLDSVADSVFATLTADLPPAGTPCRAGRRLLLPAGRGGTVLLRPHRALRRLPRP